MSFLLNISSTSPSHYRSPTEGLARAYSCIALSFYCLAVWGPLLLGHKFTLKWLVVVCINAKHYYYVEITTYFV